MQRKGISKFRINNFTCTCTEEEAELGPLLVLLLQGNAHACTTTVTTIYNLFAQR